MTRKQRVVKHKESIKVVSNDIDKNWKYDEDIKKFYHPIYQNKLFDPICSNSIVEYKVKRKNKFGKEITENRKSVAPENTFQSPLFSLYFTPKMQQNILFDSGINSA